MSGADYLVAYCRKYEAIELAECLLRTKCIHLLEPYGDILLSAVGNPDTNLPMLELLAMFFEK